MVSDIFYLPSVSWSRVARKDGKYVCVAILHTHMIVLTTWIA